MNSIGKIILALALVNASFSLLETQYGSVYDYFKENSLDLDENDLHMLADSYYINTHFLEADKANLLDQVTNKISTATSQTADIGKLIESTGGVIKTVKSTITALSDPKSLIQNGASNLFGSLFKRRLEGANDVVNNLENTITQAKNKQESITKSLDSANKFASLLKGVGELLSGNTSGFVDKVKGSISGWLKWKRMLTAIQSNGSDKHLFDFAATFKNAIQKAMANGANNSAPDANGQNPIPAQSGIQPSFIDKLKGMVANLGNKNAPNVDGENPTPADVGVQANFMDKIKGMMQSLKPAEQHLLFNTVFPTAAAPSFAPTELGKVRALFSILAAHLEHLAERDEQVTGRHRKSLFELKAIKERRLRSAQSAKNTLSYLNGVNEKSLDFHTLENHMWDLVQDEGLAGKAYLRGVETLKCILLRINCPAAQIIPTFEKTTVYYGSNQALQGGNGGAQAQKINNVVDQEGTGNFAGPGFVDANGQGQITAKKPPQFDINSVIKTVQTTISQDNGSNVIVQNDQFNPSLGNEAVIIQNESNVEKFPPISDITDANVLKTVVRQSSNDNSSDILSGSTVVVQPEFLGIAQEKQGETQVLTNSDNQKTQSTFYAVNNQAPAQQTTTFVTNQATGPVITRTSEVVEVPAPKMTTTTTTTTYTNGVQTDQDVKVVEDTAPAN